MYQYSALPSAVAYVHGGRDAPELTGEVWLYQKRESVLVVANIEGLPSNNTSGFFALHIHEGNHCTGIDFADTGNHYNPAGSPHPRHAGDLPPLLSCEGRAYLAVMTDRFRLADVVGRTIVIHNGPDDFKSQPSGNAGEKIACGVIRWDMEAGVHMPIG
ncbi:MAG: superoxide dismutase family protein [Clostridia bacterium]|nr:superoxide dismutase family protein [Clostridia bacterium]